MTTKHPLRIAFRLVWLGAEIALAGARYAARRALCARDSLAEARAVWLQLSSRRVARVFGVSLQVQGPVPERGLLVCNHLSYLDILVLSALRPAVFVAKSDVKSWPVLGWFASLAGTVFVRRESRMQAGTAAVRIQASLDRGLLVVLFPEGTSSGGETVLPFKSALLEPAAGQRHALTAGLIAYELADGDASEEVCYWKDMTFLPHLVNLLGKRRVGAVVRFSEVREGSGDRKHLARQLHDEVSRLQSGLAGTAWSVSGGLRGATLR